MIYSRGRPECFASKLIHQRGMLVGDFCRGDALNATCIKNQHYIFLIGCSQSRALQSCSRLVIEGTLFCLDDENMNASVALSTRCNKCRITNISSILDRQLLDSVQEKHGALT